MKDITTTSFGLVIAYLLPGITSLYGLSFWFSDLEKMFRSFLTAESSVGLFLIVVLASLVMGLVVNSARWLLFERSESDSLQKEDLGNLGTDKVILEAYLARIDENFRYHQAYGGLAIALPFLFSGWLWNSWSSLSGLQIFRSLVATFAIEVITVAAAFESLKRYTEGSREILKGGQNAKRT